MKNLPMERHVQSERENLSRGGVLFTENSVVTKIVTILLTNFGNSSNYDGFLKWVQI